MSEKMLKENLESSVCARAGDLVTYLYGEAVEREADDFRRHCEHCAACREELAAFGRVHEDIVEWRNRSLPAFEFSQAVTSALLEAAPQPRERSALRALREFFALSPMWMQAATAMGVLALCALVVFTVARYIQQPQQTIAQRGVQTGQALEARAEEREKTPVDEPAQPKKRETSVPQKGSVAVAKYSAPSSTVKARNVVRSQMLAKQQRRETPNKVSSSKEASQQLAELVQSQKEEDKLPRLSDLIDDSN